MSINFYEQTDYLLEIRNYSKSHLNPYPEECPICNYSIEPAYIMEYRLDLYNRSLICGCPRKDCGKIFIVEYESTIMNHGKYELKTIAPKAFPNQKFSEEIFVLSPKFAEIYNQAFIAELSGLNEICGGGYRKSLEFLVKDYAIEIDPSNEESIKGKLLKRCIVDHISHEQIAFMAERAAWLGNDEAHYVRKWGEKDVQDLKQLIKLTASFIETELISKKIQSEMAQGR